MGPRRGRQPGVWPAAVAAEVVGQLAGERLAHRAIRNRGRGPTGGSQLSEHQGAKIGCAGPNPCPGPRRATRFDHPVRLYAATRKSEGTDGPNLQPSFDLPTTGLRFLAVYGPGGGRHPQHPCRRTDEVYNHGRHARDFSCIEVDRVATRSPDHDPAKPQGVDRPMARVRHRPQQRVQRPRYIRVIVQALARRAELRMLPMQPGDVPHTQAEGEAWRRDTGCCPTTTVETGVRRFIDRHLDRDAGQAPGTCIQPLPDGAVLRSLASAPCTVSPDYRSSQPQRG
jgi:hypothetical protein